MVDIILQLQRYLREYKTQPTFSPSQNANCNLKSTAG